MKHERSLKKQTETVDKNKQDNTLIVEEGIRPEGIRDGSYLFDGKTLLVRYKEEWVDTNTAQEQIDALNALITEIQSDIADIESEITELKADVDTLESANTDNQRRITDLENDAEALQQQDINRLQNDVNDLRVDVDRILRHLNI